MIILYLSIYPVYVRQQSSLSQWGFNVTYVVSITNWDCIFMMQSFPPEILIYWNLFEMSARE